MNFSTLESNNGCYREENPVWGSKFIHEMSDFTRRVWWDSTTYHRNLYKRCYFCKLFFLVHIYFIVGDQEFIILPWPGFEPRFCAATTYLINMKINNLILIRIFFYIVIPRIHYRNFELIYLYSRSSRLDTITSTVLHLITN